MYMSNVPKITLGEQFSSLHERFEVNTPAIAELLGRIGLHDHEIADFRVGFEDEFMVPYHDRFMMGGGTVTYPGRGWTTREENGIHITGLDGRVLVHSSAPIYGQTILHELGHIDHIRKKPPMRERKQERLADRFMRKNTGVMGDLVDYELNHDAVQQMLEDANERWVDVQDQMNTRNEREAQKLMAKASKK